MIVFFFRVDAKLSLSTASPSIGGNAPELETLCLNLLHFDDSRQKENYYRVSIIIFQSIVFIIFNFNIK